MADFASSDEEACQRYCRYGNKDPFPSIPYALLNSADITDYVAQTGMIYPFPIDKKLKPASYEIDFDGDLYYWKSDWGQPEHIAVEKGNLAFVELPPNSIYFFSPRTVFRMPSYIALRFNLRIKHVHRGLLLGTGPLVDPGFCGRLLIPLHNLTSAPYRLSVGEGLIWVEFTKTSPAAEWTSTGALEPARIGKIFPFPSDKTPEVPVRYLQKASPHGTIRSSIESLAEQVNGFQKTLNLYKYFGYVAAIAVVISIASLYSSTLQTVQDAVSYVKTSKDVATDASEKKVSELYETKIKKLEERVGELESKAVIRVERTNALSAKNK